MVAKKFIDFGWNTVSLIFSLEKSSCYYYSLPISNPSGSFGFFQILPDRTCVLSWIAIQEVGDHYLHHLESQRSYSKIACVVLASSEL